VDKSPLSHGLGVAAVAMPSGLTARGNPCAMLALDLAGLAVVIVFFRRPLTAPATRQLLLVASWPMTPRSLLCSGRPDEALCRRSRTGPLEIPIREHIRRRRYSPLRRGPSSQDTRRGERSTIPSARLFLPRIQAARLPFCEPHVCGAERMRTGNARIPTR